MTTTQTAVEKRESGPGALVERYSADIALVLPTHVNPQQFVRIAQGTLRRDKNLARVAASNVGSFMSAILECARLGLEPGDTYHLVPFGNEVVGITDYTGEIELIYRTGVVASVIAELVYANDEFEYELGVHERPVHKVDWFGDRGPMIGVYAYAVMNTGATSRVVVMSETDVNKVKAVSKTANRNDSPWKQWPDRMWLKTVVHQLYNWVPSSPEYRQELARATAAVENVTPILSASIPAQDHIDHVDEDHVDEDHDVSDAEIVDVDFETGEMLEPEPEPVSEPGRAPAPPPSSPDRPATGARPMNMSQRRRLTAALRGAQINTDEKRVAWVERELGRAVSDLSEVTEVEAAELIAAAMDAAS